MIPSWHAGKTLGNDFKRMPRDAAPYRVGREKKL
jgi:hypothetical protein